MTNADASQDSGFEAALGAGLGLTSRLWYRTLAGNMRKRLAAGERVVGLAPTSEYPSVVDHARQDVAVRRSGSTATIMAYFAGGLVLGLVLDVSWPVLAALIASALVLEAWLSHRRRPHGHRSLRSLVRSQIAV